MTPCLLDHLPNTPPAATAQDAALLKVLYYFISQTARCISLKEQFIIKHCVGCWVRGEMSAFVNCFRGRAVRALDSQSAGHGFESYRGLYQLFPLFVSFTLTFLKKTTFFCFFLAIFRAGNLHFPFHYRFYVLFSLCIIDSFFF